MRTVSTAPQVEIVIPVYNEEAALETCVRRLHRFLSDELPFSWRIVVADNASVDRTEPIGRALARELRDVAYLRLEQKGRGRALRAAWSASEAPVLAYMDVDLSTDLRALLPLVAPLLSGHSDVAIGTRLAHGARVVRGPKRELISRSYNAILHTVLRARFSDAQCGFKAVRADALARLLPEVQDQGWFFDTELLVLAQRRGLRIHEVPVDWVDDPDSRVDIVADREDRSARRLAAAAGQPGRPLHVGRRRLDARLRAAVPAAEQRAGARRGRRERGRAGDDGGRQHGRQPPLDLPHPRPRRAAAPVRARRRRVRADAGADERRARGPARDRPRAGALGRADGAGRGEPGGDGDALRRAQELGLRARARAPPQRRVRQA